MNSISKNSLSLAGEFAVLSQLALRGYDANMTLGNTKSVDILVSMPELNRMFKLEVKTTFNRKPTNSKTWGITFSWIMNKKHENIIDSNLFYCFVNLGARDNPNRYFIVPSQVVADYVQQSHQAWLKMDKTNKDNPMRQIRIALDQKTIAVPAPFADKYENNWGFKK